MAIEKISSVIPSKEKLNTLLEHYQNGRLSDAENFAKSIINEFPLHQFAWKVLGAIHKQAGRINEALTSMLKSVQLAPQDAEAHNNLGVTLQELGRLEEAEASYAQAIFLESKYVEAYSNMGVTLQELGRLEEAKASYSKAITLEPDYAKAHSNLGVTLQELGRLEEAEASYIRAIELEPDYAKAHNNFGNTLKELGRVAEAEASYIKAIALEPDYAEAYSNLGISLQELGRLAEAEASYAQAIALKPDYAEAHCNLGNALKELGRLKEAKASYTQAIAFKPNLAEAHCNLGNTLQELGKLAEAEVSYNHAIRLKPQYAEAYSNMGNVLQEQGKIEEAIKACNKSISFRPDYAEAHKTLSFAFLNVGRLKEGLHEYEWRWKTDKFLSQERYFSKPLWDGKESLIGKRILIWCEQGIGDTIMWSSHLSLVSSQAEHCILECQEKLVPLLERSFPNVEVKAENRSLDLERDDFDFHLPMGSLYKQFIEEISQNAKVGAYLVPDPVRVKFWKERLKSLGKGPYIGISWKSSNMSPERLPNYAPISKLSPTLTIPDVTFVNMQSTDFKDDLNKIKDDLGVTVHNFDDLDHFNNIDDVAALCTALDMVVSTKTTVPLISAAVGTSTKLANWKQSPWNNILLNPVGPSVDIFERNTWEPWDNVFCLIAEDINTYHKTN